MLKRMDLDSTIAELVGAKIASKALYEALNDHHAHI